MDSRTSTFHYFIEIFSGSLHIMCYSMNKHFDELRFLEYTVICYEQFNLLPPLKNWSIIYRLSTVGRMLKFLD